MISKILKIKGIGYILIALAAGIVLLFLPSGSEKTVTQKTASAEEYADMLENKVESIITRINGVKSCKVMITLESGFTYLYASDQSLERSFGDDGKELSNDTTKKYVVVTVGGNGELVLVKETMPSICGIAIVCPGVGAEVQLRIIETVKALFGLSSNKISVQN